MAHLITATQQQQAPHAPYARLCTSSPYGNHRQRSIVRLDRAQSQPFHSVQQFSEANQFQGIALPQQQISSCATRRKQLGELRSVSLPIAFAEKTAKATEQPVCNEDRATQIGDAIEGLEEFLIACRLEGHSGAISKWCHQMGAVYIDEVLDNRIELADSIPLSPEERSRLLRAEPFTVSASSGKDDSTASVCPSSKTLRVVPDVMPSSSHVAPFPESRMLHETTSPECAVSTQSVVQISKPITAPAMSPLLMNRSRTTVHDEIQLKSTKAETVLMRTRTNPVTSPEMQVAQLRTEQAYIPLRAWCPDRIATHIIASEKIPALVDKHGINIPASAYRVTRPFTAGAASVQHGFQQAREEGLTELEWLDEAVVGLPTFRERKTYNMDHYYRKWEDPRRGWVEPHLLHQRMPTAQEMMNPFLSEIAQAKKARAAAHTSRSFEEIRTQFLKEHGSNIKANLSKCFDGNMTIVPAPVSKEVQRRFEEGYTIAPDGEVIPTYHGSMATNYDSICSRGLLIPGKGNELQVVNGAVHGRGVYTARVEAPQLSRCFCSEPKMLICGVVDDADPLSHRECAGRFTVSAKSQTIKHVGDAVIVADDRRVAPLFQVTADEFKNSWGTPLSAGPQTVITLQQWLNGRMPLPDRDPPIKFKVGDFRYRKGKALHVASGQTAWLPPEPEGYAHGIRRKRIFETKRRDLQRSELRARKVADQQW